MNFSEHAEPGILIDIFDAELWGIEENLRIGLDGMREPDVCADDRFAVQYRRAGVDGHVVLDRGMTFFLDDFVGIGDAECTKRNALIYLNIFSDEGGFANDDAGTVIDEEA